MRQELESQGVGSGTETPLRRDVSDSLPDNVVDPKSFGGIELQGVGGSGAATGWDERFPKG